MDALPQLRMTLREHYTERRRLYGLDYPNVYDRELRRLFSSLPEYQNNLSAARFVARVRREVRPTVARWTGEYQYTIAKVIDDIIDRCRELRLHLVKSEEQTKLDFTLLLTVQTMNYLHSGRHRVWL